MTETKRNVVFFQIVFFPTMQCIFIMLAWLLAIAPLDAHWIKMLQNLELVVSLIFLLKYLLKYQCIDNFLLLTAYD